MPCSLLGATRLVCIASVIAACARADINVTSWNLEVRAGSLSDGSYVSTNFNTVSLPFLFQSHEVFDDRQGEPSSISAADYNFDFAGDALNFNFSFLQSRNEFSGTSASATGDIFFNVDEARAYALDGLYTRFGDSNVRLMVQLFDLTAGSVTFLSDQESVGGSETALTLGETNGDVSNSLTGALNGLLLAGHDYRFSYYASVFRTAEFPDGGSDGEGELFFGIGEPTVIPSPTSSALGVLGLVSAALLRRR